ncbi:MAG: D-alanyl-D-alanine carboxypeptidase [Lachnospiraceae bacterium]|nr:D-alanyl-D-alanine carboxypeptidase [Lachnospiraceae bacterium]
MRLFLRKTAIVFLSLILILTPCFPANAQTGKESGIAPIKETPSYILIEAQTGQVIAELNANERLAPASITKIMTLLIIFDFIDKGRVKLEHEIITSAYAKSMGGSQVFLEEGEIQTLETLIKCIAVASGNDASVAVAEHIAGSEAEFVKLMNERARELGMRDTNFTDSSGLTDDDNHYMSAKDVATVSRELITKYPEVLEYTQIWMEDIIHNTVQGSSVFTLSSTNKLLRMYEWATGLKTGSTSKAKFCLSATASRDGIDLIAVIMAAPSGKTRFEEAMALLNYGYTVSQLFEDKNEDALPVLPIRGSVEDYVEIEYQGPFKYLDIKGSDLTQIEKVINLPGKLTAPVNKGDAIGEAVYRLNGERVGSVSIFSAMTVEKAGYIDYLGKAFRLLLV